MLVRYLARIYAGGVIVSHTVLVTLIVAVTLVDRSSALRRSHDAVLLALRLSMAVGVEFAYRLLPVSLMLGLLVAGAVLAQRGELLACATAGVGPKHLGWAIAWVALGSMGCAAALGEWGLPWVQQDAAEVRRVAASGKEKKAQTLYYTRSHWYDAGFAAVYLPEVDPVAETFAKVSVYEIDKGVLSAVITAKWLRYQKGTWWLEDGTRHTMADAEVEAFARRMLPLQVSAQDLIEVTGDPRQLGMVELWKVAHRRKRAGYDAAAYSLAFYRRLSLPLSLVLVAWAAMPWALNPNRRRSVISALGGGALAVVAYLAITYIAMMIAQGGDLPAWAGAFIPLGLWALCAPFGGYVQRRLG